MFFIKREEVISHPKKERLHYVLSRERERKENKEKN